MKKVLIGIFISTGLLSCGPSIDSVAEKGCTLVTYYNYYQEDPENKLNVELSQKDLKTAMEKGGFTLEQVEAAMSNCEADASLLKRAFGETFEENQSIPEEQAVLIVPSCSVTIKKNGEEQTFVFEVSSLSYDACWFHEGFTVLNIMDSRNWSISISFKGNETGEFELDGTSSLPNIVTVNVGLTDYMSSLEYGMLFITEITEDNWIKGKFLGFTGKNKEIEVKGNFTIQAKRYQQ
tara:strand:+ start:188 stop:895 length:708 start_codon:yes stop_codon:yes gene_type:complete